MQGPAAFARQPRHHRRGDRAARGEILNRGAQQLALTVDPGEARHLHAANDLALGTVGLTRGQNLHRQTGLDEALGLQPDAGVARVGVVLEHHQHIWRSLAWDAHWSTQSRRADGARPKAPVPDKTMSRRSSFRPTLGRVQCPADRPKQDHEGMGPHEGVGPHKKRLPEAVDRARKPCARMDARWGFARSAIHGRRKEF